MSHRHRAKSSPILLSLILLIALIVGACNLGGSPEESIDITSIPTNTVPPTRTLPPTSGVPTQLPVATFSFPTQQSQLPPTSIGFLPTAVIPPTATNTPLPVSIVILSPIPGNVVAGTVQILGSASHPQFLQYQVEFGPDPNYSNLWFPATGVVQTPVMNNLLGIWSTVPLNDGLYQLRLRVFLRDGTELTTVVNNVRVQNHAPTPQPSATPIIPRPIAAFTQDHTTGLAPLVVKYTNQSSGNITSYSWEFGDGGTSPNINPIHTYQSPGVYTVKLKVAGPGGTSNVSKQITVQSATAPVAAFTADKTSGQSPLVVQFTSQSTGSITGYAWNFGDGTTSTEVNPSHTFTPVGTYNVILKVTGPGGSSNVTRQITVENPQIPAPVAAFTPSMIGGEVPLTVSFTNDSTGNITNYLWDFDGDGLTDSTDTSPTHIYTDAGTYAVRLRVIGPGGQDLAEATITTTKPPDEPVADFALSPVSGNIPLTVTFTNQSTGDITTYEWDFDGDDVADSTDENPSHTYTTQGTYTVTLTVTGPGGSSSQSAAVSATEPIAAPVADFTVDKTSGEAPLTVAFTNQSSGDDLSFSWDLNGDGVVDSTDANPPTYTYTTAGNYAASLDVSNPVGSDSHDVTITVSEAVVIAPPVAGFVANPPSGNPPLTVNFSNQSTGDITGYAWDFNGDGVVDSTDTSPIHTYDTVGMYTVSLVASGPGGDSTPATGTITISALAPTAGFVADPLSGDPPLVVNFTNQSTGDITGYSWDFNSDSVVDSTDANPVHTFDTPGMYTVSLVATGPGGNSAPATATITVNTPAVAPTASFFADPMSGDPPLVVNFTNQSTGDITGYSWDFNSDSVVDSTDANPVHTFDTPGMYTVSLVATGPGGDSTPATATITVNTPATAPTASFFADPLSGDPPLTVNFTNQSTGDITGYSWDFNSDSVVDSTDTNPVHTFDTPGMYTVSLVATGPGGDSTPATATITVNTPATAPTASFFADPLSGDPPLVVNFTNQSTGDITGYSWDFNGDSVVDSTDTNPVHTFDTPGVYTVSLVATGPGGNSAPATATITVNTPAVAPTASFFADPMSGDPPLTVNFTNQSSGDITGYSWDFNSDAVVDSTDTNPVHVFDTAGMYTVSLVATGPGGDSTPATAMITVNTPATAPTASFFADPMSGDPPLTVNFTNQSSGDITGYAWDFNSDAVVDSTDTNPVHVFDTPGVYGVSLVATGPGGDSAPATATITVNTPAVAPTASFFADPLSGDPPLVVNFTNQSSGDITGYSWDFNGDSVVDSTDTNPVHTFDTPGVYQVSLVVTGPGGNSAPAMGTITVNTVVVGPSERIAFVTNRDGNFEIYTMKTDGSTLTNVTNNGANDTMPAWSPDGTKIAFVSDRSGDNDIFVINVGNGQVTQLTVNPANDNSPTWSPDGSQIAFVSDRMDSNNNIFVLNVSDGSIVAQLTSEMSNDNGPTWKPDSSQIAFVSDRSGNNDIYIMNASDGSIVGQPTTDGANDHSPKWKPNGNQIAFVSDRSGNNDIYVLNVSDGSIAAQPTTDGANDHSPAWSPDGNQVAFVSDQFGDNDIFVVTVSDGTTVQLTTESSDDNSPSWVTIP